MNYNYTDPDNDLQSFLNSLNEIESMAEVGLTQNYFAETAENETAEEILARAERILLEIEAINMPVQLLNPEQEQPPTDQQPNPPSNVISSKPIETNAQSVDIPQNITINDDSDEDVVFVGATTNYIPVVDLSASVDEAPTVTASCRRRCIESQSASELPIPNPHKRRSISPSNVCTSPTTSRPKHNSVSAVDPAPQHAPAPAPQKMCPVCMENIFDNEPTSTHCGHVFCFKCIRQVIKVSRKCPLCNKKLLQHNIHRIYF